MIEFKFKDIMYYHSNLLKKKKTYQWLLILLQQLNIFRTYVVLFAEEHIQHVSRKNMKIY